MDRDRIEGSGTKMKGDLKETAGRVTGDQKLQQEGAMDKVKGKIQNAIGGIKDALRGNK
ncbi:MAG TPA: CsbD family protein [Azospirillum sp.]|nr:CsbD family protein [Azospirillum sp.]